MEEVQCPWCYATLFAMPPCEIRCDGCKNRVVVDEDNNTTVVITS